LTDKFEDCQILPAPPRHCDWGKSRLYPAFPMISSSSPRLHCCCVHSVLCVDSGHRCMFDSALNGSPRFSCSCSPGYATPRRLLDPLHPWPQSSGQSIDNNRLFCRLSTRSMLWLHDGCSMPNAGSDVLAGGERSKKREIGIPARR
jgi:hypothetical protein